MKKYVVLSGVLLCLFYNQIVSAEWTNPFVISDSLEVVGQPQVLNNFSYEYDTTWAVWTGKRSDEPPEIFATKFWSEDGTLQHRTSQLSQSGGHVCGPTITAQDYKSAFPIIAWCEEAAVADSVEVKFRQYSMGTWTPAETLATIPVAPWIYLYPGQGLWLQATSVMVYPTEDFQYLMQIGFDPDEPKATVRDTLQIQYFGEIDSLTDFHISSFFTGDLYQGYGIGRVTHENDSKIIGGWYLPYLEGFWDIDRVYEGIGHMALSQGNMELPSMSWVSPGAEIDTLNLLKSRWNRHPMLPPFTWNTFWEEDITKFPIDREVGGLAVRFLDSTKTVVAWDAETNGNREIFLRSDNPMQAEEQITDNPANDFNPQIMHFPAAGDSFKVIVLWQSDRDGDNHLWAASSGVPVAIDDEPAIPQRFQVSQNYPNPFNSETTIEYQVPQTGNIFIDVFNLRGQRILSETRSVQTAGTYSYRWDGTNELGMTVSSGIYLIRVRLTDSRNIHRSIRTVRAVLLK